MHRPSLLVLHAPECSGEAHRIARAIRRQWPRPGEEPDIETAFIGGPRDDAALPAVYVLGPDGATPHESDLNRAWSARRAAIVLCPPSSSRLSRSEASWTMARAARISTGLALKCAGGQAIKAACKANTRSPSLTSISALDGRSSRRSKIDVSKSRPVGLLPPLGARTSSCRGTLRFPVSRQMDCSALRHHALPKRSFR